MPRTAASTLKTFFWSQGEVYNYILYLQLKIQSNSVEAGRVGQYLSKFQFRFVFGTGMLQFEIILQIFKKRTNFFEKLPKVLKKFLFF